MSEAKTRPKSITLPPSHVFFTPDFIPILIKSIFHVIKVSRDFFPVTNRTYCTDQILYFLLFVPMIKLRCINPNPYCIYTKKSFSTFYAHTLCHLLLFAVILFSFSYLTTLVPFRNTWISTA